MYPRNPKGGSFAGLTGLQALDKTFRAESGRVMVRIRPAGGFRDTPREQAERAAGFQGCPCGATGERRTEGMIAWPVPGRSALCRSHGPVRPPVRCGYTTIGRMVLSGTLKGLGYRPFRPSLAFDGNGLVI